MANIKQIKIGTTTYDIKATYDGGDNVITSTYVKKSGDTMTGDLNIQHDVEKGTDPASTQMKYIRFIDENSTNNRTGFLLNQVGTDGKTFTGIYAVDFTQNSNDKTYIGVFKPKGGDGYALVSGDTENSSNEKVIRNIGYGTGAPSGGSNGDMYVQYNTVSTHPFLDMVYPVGAIYLSTVNTNPGSLFGGTWEQIKDRFLLAAGDTYSAGDTGGAATMAHTHPISHTHYEGDLRTPIGAVSSNIFTIAYQSNSLSSRGPSSVGQYTIWGADAGSGSRSYNHHTRVYGTTGGVNTANSGAASSTNNMPPYLTVYCWKRTA